ncbi:Eco57I restriction-modification methylase domain-containing protein [Polaromonas sp. C04]|uniref:Eco57I restriction-modification methylase domain-containing protein n=1 Tax=Polaromonas sp. C04 TaxID=1945857 RepID=UPI000985D960|nr:Eco57I restriction-modification methylase domain-containing protein [Polaromonas sp. C04]
MLPTLSQPLLLEQPALPGFCQVTEAVHGLAHASSVGERGAIFTRREVVDFILDLVGYEAPEPLYERTLLEPSFGSGDFLLPAIGRLLASRKKALAEGKNVGRLAGCIRAVELHRDTFDRGREKVIGILCQEGFSATDASELADAWLIHGDFLLAQLPGSFDFVVGNPPYVRQELIPAALLQEYRRRFLTLYDRADLYIPFIERSLCLLAEGGKLGLICADRWMKNRYGGPLRALVARNFHLRAYVDMVDTPAFHSEVVAYPAITLIAKEAPGPTRVAAQPEIEVQALKTLARALTLPNPSALVHELRDVTSGEAPWVLHASERTDLVRRIESAFPTLEEAGCNVGIGVATGADKVYIGMMCDLDVEDDRKIPLAMTRDIGTGQVEWRGYGVINPFTDEGPLVDLVNFPRLKRYLEAHKPAIVGRHVAQKAPANWYRTIDRITPSLARRPKLLIPDIKGEAQVVFENGMLYPHHNLYFVTSDTWELRALQAVLLSRLTRLFIATYSTKMRGGFLRFQAQYLRRIRLPRWESVAAPLRERLMQAAVELDVDACDEVVAVLYSLTKQEREVLAGTQ